MGIFKQTSYQNNENGIILVTGASGYLGGELIKRLLTRPKRIFLVASRQYEQLSQQYKDQAQVKVLKHDFSKQTVEQLFEQIPTPELLETVYHLASPNPGKSTFEDLFRVNVTALNEFSERLLPHFLQRGWGQVYVMGSRYALYPARDLSLRDYAMAKASQLSATRYWAAQTQLPFIKWIYLAPTHLASPLNALREGLELMPVSSFLDHLMERLDGYKSGDAVFFDYRREQISETRLDASGASSAGTTSTINKAESPAAHLNEVEFIKRIKEIFPSTQDMNEAEILALQFGGVQEWDSLGHLRLVVEMEGRFKKKIPYKMVPKLTSMKAVFKAIQG